MKNQDVMIVVSGDICINMLTWKTQFKSAKGLNWQQYPYVHSIIKFENELLLSKLVALSTGLEVRSPKIECNESYLTNDILISNAELDLFPITEDSKNKGKVYRIKNYLGFSGVESGTPKLFPVNMDNEDANIVIIDDENNGFNSNKEFWPTALKLDKKVPVIIYKTNNLEGSNNLWSHIEKYHIQNTIVVINADDLRSKGVNISKSLSWEKTSQDFVWQMNNNPNLFFLSKCKHLIVLFGVEGAIHYKNTGKSESELYFLPNLFEGEFIKEEQGKMYGLTSCFVAGIARHIVTAIKNDDEFDIYISEGIREGIVAAQKYFIYGFGNCINKGVFPNPSTFEEGAKDFIYKENIHNIKIRDKSTSKKPWYIIQDNSSVNLADIAYELVKYGEKKALKFIPIARFGNLRTVDRTEIEGYRSIKKLISEYISANNTVRPLSIAVFGTPGSGKSFGIIEVASSIAPKLIKKVNFNLSQFESQSDLIAAFHKTRDISLEGYIPLVFFDEFDSNLGEKLGWLKYFLSPMQDGEFREGDTIHPIGKSIFVFAGGTSSTFDEFCGENILDENEKKVFLKEFQSAKGPDFISRLRGYVNILGPNQTDEKKDQLFIIRRAMLLRALLERKVPHLIGDNGEAQIDNDVLRALLKVPYYKHESRSMEAILEMSMLNSAKKWEQSCLPSKEQLKLHVDEEQFSRYLMQDAFFSEKVEKLAKELYSNHLNICEKSDYSNFNDLKPWEMLSEKEKNYFVKHVRNIPTALYMINYDVISVKEKPEIISFTEKELNILAEYEHNQIVLAQKKAKEKFLKKFDKDIETHPFYLYLSNLYDSYKVVMIENINSWPEILANLNFKIEKLNF